MGSRANQRAAAGSSSYAVSLLGADHSVMTSQRLKDVCGHCDTKCTSKGQGSDAICCDYCGYWVNASCDGMSREEYRMFSQLAKKVSDMSYYCSYNHCKR